MNSTMIRTRNAIAAIAVTVSLHGNVYGSPCPRIEYADARDWPVEKLEAGYCDAVNTMHATVRDADAAMKLSGVRSANLLLAQGEVCAERADMFERVLANVHKRKAPACRT